MAIRVVPYDDAWPRAFEQVAADLRTALRDVPRSEVQHVGSTSVPGLAAKPILDIDVIVDASAVSQAVAALERAGYRHLGDLGRTDREAFAAPDDDPRRHVYVVVRGSLHLRNHLAVRDVLRDRGDLRDRYGAVKRALARDQDLDIDAYIARKSAVLQDVLAVSELTEQERREIWELNDPNVRG